MQELKKYQLSLYRLVDKAFTYTASTDMPREELVQPLIECFSDFEKRR